MQILDECEDGWNRTSLKSPFNSCRTLYFYQLLHWKALCFQARWGWLRGKKIYNFRFVKQATGSCVKFVQTTDSSIWICMDSDGPCLLFRLLLWLFRLVPPLFLATFISFLHSPKIRNFHSPNRAWNKTISVVVLEKKIYQ